jgi:capsular exopolysaccharide synthesis family protein
MSKFAKARRQAEQDAALGKGNLVVEKTREPNGLTLVEGALRPAGSEPSQLERRPMAACDPSAEASDDRLVSLISPAAFEAEQYRALRHAVEEMHKTANVRVVAVSSPAVGDGKTTTAINLAGALAQSPQAKVLLVDADVRRPAVGALLRHLDATPGLIDAILDPACTLEQMVAVRPQFNLSFIHAGRGLPSNPYELLKSPRVGDLLEEARRRFDYVIVDTPPLAVVQDCRLIASWVDGFLVVVAANRTPRRLVEEAMAVIEPAKVFGLVFNGDTDGAHTSYYGYTRSYLHTRPAPDRRVASSAGSFGWVWPRRQKAR